MGDANLIRQAYRFALDPSVEPAPRFLDVSLQIVPEPIGACFLDASLKT